MCNSNKKNSTGNRKCNGENKQPFMREATKEERECVANYIKSISHSTGINFFDEIEKANKKN